MDIKLKDIMNTASTVVEMVGPMIRIVSPSSEVALKLAEVLDAATNVLRFGTSILDEHLPELAAAFAEIQKEVDELSALGDSVPTDRWTEIENDVTTSVARVRAAMLRR